MKYLIQHKSEYYQLLRKVTEQADCESWILFMLEAVRSTSESTLKHILTIRDLLGTIPAEVREAVPQIYSKELVELLLVRPYCKVHVIVDADIAKHQTAAKYLKSLKEMRLLNEIKVVRERLYINTRFLKLLSTPYVDDIDT